MVAVSKEVWDALTQVSMDIEDTTDLATLYEAQAMGPSPMKASQKFAYCLPKDDDPCRHCLEAIEVPKILSF